METNRPRAPALAVVAAVVLTGGCVAEPSSTEVQLSEHATPAAVEPVLLDGFQMGPAVTVDLEEGDVSGWEARELAESDIALALERAPRTLSSGAVEARGIARST